MVAYPKLASIRLGYGLSPHGRPPVSPDEVLGAARRGDSDSPAVGMEQVREVHARIADLGRAVREGDKDAEAARKKELQRTRRLVDTAIQRRFATAVDDPVGFGERLVQFWSDHFTVSGGNAYQQLMAMSFVEEAIRPNIGATFAKLMFAAETHPRMVTYLDQHSSVGPNHPSRSGGRRGVGAG